MFLQSRIPKHIIYLAENGPLLAGFFTGPLDIKPKDEKHMRVAAIVTHDPSDLYFANQLAKRYNLVGIIVESQLLPLDQTPKWIKALRLAGNPGQLATKTCEFLAGKLRERFAVYLRPENAADFGEEGRALYVGNDVNVLTTKGAKRINDQEYVDWLKNMNPDVVAVCGASMMKAPIMSVPRLGMLNLHGGLSQNYRGLFTTDWAFYNEEPEYIGTLAADNPGEFFHKASLGQPDAPMPVGRALGWSLEDIADVTSFAQTLPTQ